MYTLHQYERDHFICLKTVILETMQVRPSLTAICCVVHLNATFSYHEHTQGKLRVLNANSVFLFILAHRVQRQFAST